MSFANFLQRSRARQQAPPPALPPVPAYQGPIRQDLNLFELTGQTMGAPAAPSRLRLRRPRRACPTCSRPIRLPDDHTPECLRDFRQRVLPGSGPPGAECRLTLIKDPAPLVFRLARWHLKFFKKKPDHRFQSDTVSRNMQLTEWDRR